MNHPITQNQILDVVMSLNIDQRVDVLSYVSRVQKNADDKTKYKTMAMSQIKEALIEDALF